MNGALVTPTPGLVYQSTPQQYILLIYVMAPSLTLHTPGDRLLTEINWDEGIDNWRHQWINVGCNDSYVPKIQWQFNKLT